MRRKLSHGAIVDPAIVDDAIDQAADRTALRPDVRNPDAYARVVAKRSVAKQAKKERRRETIRREHATELAPVLPSSGAIEDALIDAIDERRETDRTDGRKRPRRARDTRAHASASDQRDQINAYARQVFEESTGVRWTQVIADRFSSWIGPGNDYTEWNRDVQEAKKLRGALQRALQHADMRKQSPCDFFEYQIGEDLREYMRWYGHRIDWLAQEKRVWSRDVRLHRYVSLHSFLGLGRMPKLDELTAMSILLGHNVSPEPEQSPRGYFRRHRSRMLNVVKQHPKMTREQVEQQRLERGPQRAVDWPPTEPTRKTDKG